MPRMTRRRAIGAGVAGIAAIGGYFTVSGGGSDTPSITLRDPDGPDPATVGAGALDDTLAPPMLGDGSIGVTVFKDFACPACGRFAREFAPQLRADYPEAITYVHRDFPLEQLHPRARPVANAARAVQVEAGVQAFWTFAEAAVDQEGTYSNATIEQLGDEAAGVGATARTAATDRLYADRIDADLSLGRRLGVEGVPMVFVDGLYVPIQEVESLRGYYELIDAAISRRLDTRE